MTADEFHEEQSNVSFLKIRMTLKRDHNSCGLLSAKGQGK